MVICCGMAVRRMGMFKKMEALTVKQTVTLTKGDKL